MAATCPRCSAGLADSFRYGHIQFRITCAGCDARLQGNWVVYVLGAGCGILSMSGLLVLGLLWEKSRALAGAAAGLTIGICLELFRFGCSRWARFVKDDD
jgi:hypothetical protein